MNQQPRTGGRIRTLGEVLKELLREKTFHQKGRHTALSDAWAAIVGEAIAERTRIRSFEGGELVVEVNSPVLLHELNGFMREQLLSAIQQRRAGRDVAALKFCLGNSSHD